VPIDWLPGARSAGGDAFLLLVRPGPNTDQPMSLKRVRGNSFDNRGQSMINLFFQID
jgi:hypothetical protein